jgi:hypothetical protein
MRGAIREDDVCLSPLQFYCDGPFEEIRVLNHFFDPVNNEPLNAGGIPILGAEKATDWVT